MKNNQKLMHWFCAGLCLLLLSACGSGPAPKDYFYRLEALGVDKLASPLSKKSVEVERFKSDLVTDDRSLVYRESLDTPELKNYTYHRWSDTPTRLMQSVFTRGLRDANFTSGSVMEADGRSSPDYFLHGRIYHLEEVKDDGHFAIVDLDLALRDKSNKKNRFTKNYRVQEDISGGDHADVVAAYNRALGIIVSDFISDARAAGLF
jgi:ABC-type uncharacterized transport system auxiliary subunit